ncbi:hypothetical protein FNO01nite_34400 [Flavobacterium noncentrifugens]|uniref:Uncharacterized protein n=1 Tax=Flavobacterium noncentrifugens TaxID=1128970 RepID=A0A1G9C1K2_9FLAO|nr:hypothetical protein [Flavobacterium noncentrifugens]GEP52768.1 hypothetical protein FNO01nite_34400 [Flavobacterium noncentrifugens]SDK45566.1 hypothetical protein SAMN04487935_3439 [Flavobacterium noncentrifugens]
MKRTFTIFILFFVSNLFPQTVSEINKVIKIPDSLSNEKEIRIYKRYSITNASEIFRMYQTKEKKWKAELYKYYHETNSTQTKFELQKLESNTDLRLVWLFFIENDIQILKSIKQIKHKLKGKPEYQLIDGEYEVISRQIHPLDGIGYEAFVRTDNYKHNFDFSNYDQYLKYYPKVDELNSYSEIINILQKEFNIWKS